MQTTSLRGISDLIFSEGEKDTAYRDSVGVETIGVGHTASAGGLKPVPGMTITHEQAIALLQEDFTKFETRVRQALGPVPQNVFDGAVSFDFNTGAILRVSTSWVPLYKMGKLSEAEAHFLEWNKPASIIQRRKREAQLIFHGVYHTPAPTNVPPPRVVLVPPPMQELPAPQPASRSWFLRLLDWLKVLFS